MLERATDALVVTIAVGAVLWGGTTRPPATLALALAAAVLVILVAVRARQEERFVRLAPLAIPLCASLLVALVQLVPLPPSMRAALSPEISRIEGLALVGLAPSGWRPLTSDVGGTVHAALRLATLVALAVATGSLGRRKRAVLRGALAAAIGALILVCALHAVGVALPPPLIYEGATRLGHFPFFNANHAAALLTLVLPVVVVLAIRRSGALRVAAVALALAGNAVLWTTLSRAGVVLGVVAQAVAVAAVIAPGRGRARVLAAFAAVALGLGLAVAARPMISRFEVISTDGRFGATRDALRMIGDHKLAGVGTGAFSLAFSRYSERTARNRYGFIENEYLQVPLDSGIAGAVLVLAGLVLAARVACPSLRQASSSARAALVGLAAVAVHNAVDFNFEAGGVAVSVCIAAALAFRSAGPRLPTPALAAIGVVLASLLGWAVSPSGRTADAEGSKLAARLAPTEIGAADVQALAAASFAAHPRDGYLADLAAEALITRADPAAFSWLDRALLVSPYDLFAHRLLARGLARAGLRDQAAGELRFGLDLANSRDSASLIDEALSLFSREEDAERLVRVVPDDRGSWKHLLERLVSMGRWRQAVRVTEGLLKRDEHNALAQRVRLEAAVRLDEKPTAGAAVDLVKLAERLVEVDRSADALKLASDILTRAEQHDRAEVLLRSALEKAQGSTADLAIQLSQRLSGRGQLDAATVVLEQALARAVTTGEKARLHRAGAAVEELAGHLNRAALERAEAARLEHY